MNAHVWRVVGDIKLKSGKFTGGTGLRVIFKELDTNVQYTLNLPYGYERAGDWIPSLEEGNVFFGLGTSEVFGKKIIAWWVPFVRVEIKEKNRGQ